MKKKYRISRSMNTNTDCIAFVQCGSRSGDCGGKENFRKPVHIRTFEFFFSLLVCFNAQKIFHDYISYFFSLFLSVCIVRCSFFVCVFFFVKKILLLNKRQNDSMKMQNVIAIVLIRTKRYDMMIKLLKIFFISIGEDERFITKENETGRWKMAKNARTLHRNMANKVMKMMNVQLQLME